MTVDYEEESKGIIIGQPTCTVPLFCSYRLVVLQCVVIVVTWFQSLHIHQAPRDTINHHYKYCEVYIHVLYIIKLSKTLYDMYYMYTMI